MNEDDDDDDADADDGWDGLAGPAWETRCSSDDAHATDKDGRCKTGISHAAPIQYRFERAVCIGLMRDTSLAGKIL